LFHKNQTGFTLIELMLAIAISGIITGGITATIFQVVIGSARTSNHMTAVRQVQNAGYWVSHDAKMAQSVGLGASSGFPLALTWTDWDNNEHVVTYTLEDMTGGLKQLEQSHSITGKLTETSIIAQFIDPGVLPAEPKTKVEFASGALTFTVTATVGGGSQGQSETRVYKIVPSPSLW
jgi:prepilin-type N-terminal cleavage/methylation domain-containing protein